jgi:hypothetical protein
LQPQWGIQNTFPNFEQTLPRGETCTIMMEAKLPTQALADPKSEQVMGKKLK